MRLSKRIERLERAAGITGECRVCGGRGRGRTAFCLDGIDLAPEGPTGCPMCGKGHVSKRIVVNGLDEEQTRVLRFLARCPAPAA